ncbi:hypothetical protein [Actinacidiphila acidipaludis]|uniref:Uncharacterized protein n=1 Tax=Actinacidiphila acidipaludis TaxID=2873382 RepID=A0ABS7QLI1_9ACTN|nr:hypothetical protein [Streptomyces acidipaludis]MBY8882659.1 hypothetical protein [Streptomyces acidipaludis]
MTAGTGNAENGQVRSAGGEGPRWAAEAVALAGGAGGARGGIRLDYSVRSLVLVDRVIDGARRQEATREKVAGALLRFGAYTGEVLVRCAGAQWVDFGAAQRLVFGQPFGTRTPDGRVWNPLGKAFKRFDYGAEESLHRFALAVLGAAHP